LRISEKKGVESMKFYIKNLTKSEGKILQSWGNLTNKCKVNFTDVDVRVDYEQPADKDNIISYLKSRFDKKILIADSHYNNIGVEIK